MIRSERRDERPTPAETTQRWARFSRNPTRELRNSLILQYTPLVKYVIRQMAITAPPMMDHGDILADGTVGLIDAVQRFDPAKGVKFETFAILRIRGAIIDKLRKADRLTRTARQHVREVDAARETLRQTLRREPTVSEITGAMAITQKRYDTIMAAARATVSLDHLMDQSYGKEEYSPLESTPDMNALDLSDWVEREDDIAALTIAIGGLGERERLIVSLYYQDELTQREIAKVLEISDSRVCQLHAAAIKRLRKSMLSQEGQVA